MEPSGLRSPTFLPVKKYSFNDDYKPSGKKGNLVEKNSQFRISLPTEV